MAHQSHWVTCPLTRNPVSWPHGEKAPLCPQFPRGHLQKQQGLGRKGKTLDSSFFLLPVDALLLSSGQKLSPGGLSLPGSGPPSFVKPRHPCPFVVPPEPTGSDFWPPPPGSPLTWFCFVFFPRTVCSRSTPERESGSQTACLTPELSRGEGGSGKSLTEA